MYLKTKLLQIDAVGAGQELNIRVVKMKIQCVRCRVLMGVIGVIQSHIYTLYSFWTFCINIKFWSGNLTKTQSEFKIIVEYVCVSFL